VSTAGGKTINTDADEANQMAGSLAFADSEKTISSGAITPTRTYHTVDTESDAGSDFLDTMATGSVSDGAIVILAANNASRTVVIRHEQTAGAGDFHLAGGQNYTMDDAIKRIVLQRDGADWYEVSRQQGSQVVQVVNNTDSAVATGTTVTVDDDTIPQNDEGIEFLTQAITPINTANILLIEVVVNMANSNGGNVHAALFQDTTANALAAISHRAPTVDVPYTLAFNHYMAAGTTSETTFKVRGGWAAAGTTTLNGVSGSRKLGGVMASSITITELAPSS